MHRKGLYCTSDRSWDWQNRKEANTLSGSLVRHRTVGHEEWSGLALTAEPLEPPKVRSVTYWKDFLGGRRTMDPSYPAKETHSGVKVSFQRRNSSGSLQAMIDSSNPRDTFGFRTKSVYQDGKLRSEHTSDHGMLTHSSSVVKVQTEQVVRKQVDLRTFASQITTLPGTVFRSEVNIVKLRRPRTDNQSHIANLPGHSEIGFEQQIANPVKKFARCTATSLETEDALGAVPVRSGPKNVERPQKGDLPSYQSVGVDDTDVKRGKRITTRTAHQQSTAEENFSKGCKAHQKPVSTVSFKLF